jgi:hypothetical protein
MLHRLDGEVGAGAGVVALPDRGRVSPGIHHQLQMLPTPSVTGSDVGRPRPAPSGRAGRALDDEITTVGTLPDRGHLALRADRDLRVLYVAVPALEMLTGADQVPPAGRVAVWIRRLVDALPAQTAVALPWESTATCGQPPTTPLAESATGADQIPPDVRVELSIAPLYSSLQTAVAPPWGSSAIWRYWAAFLGGDRVTGTDQVPPADRVAL